MLFRMQWPFACLGLANGAQFRQCFSGCMLPEVGLMSVSQIWFGKRKALFVLCFYESACRASCACKWLMVMQSAAHLQSAPHSAVHWWEETNILHALCAARGQAIFLTLQTLWA